MLFTKESMMSSECWKQRNGHHQKRKSNKLLSDEHRDFLLSKPAVKWIYTQGTCRPTWEVANAGWQQGDRVTKEIVKNMTADLRQSWRAPWVEMKVDKVHEKEKARAKVGFLKSRQRQSQARGKLVKRKGQSEARQETTWPWPSLCRPSGVVQSRLSPSWAEAAGSAPPPCLVTA